MLNEKLSYLDDKFGGTSIKILFNSSTSFEFILSSLISDFQYKFESIDINLFPSFSKSSSLEIIKLANTKDESFC